MRSSSDRVSGGEPGDRRSDTSESETATEVSTELETGIATTDASFPLITADFSGSGFDSVFLASVSGVSVATSTDITTLSTSTVEESVFTSADSTEGASFCTTSELSVSVTAIADDGGSFSVLSCVAADRVETELETSVLMEVVGCVSSLTAGGDMAGDNSPGENGATSVFTVTALIATVCEAVVSSRAAVEATVVVCSPAVAALADGCRKRCRSSANLGRGKSIIVRPPAVTVSDTVRGSVGGRMSGPRVVTGESGIIHGWWSPEPFLLGPDVDARLEFELTSSREWVRCTFVADEELQLESSGRTARPGSAGWYGAVVFAAEKACPSSGPESAESADPLGRYDRRGLTPPSPDTLDVTSEDARWRRVNSAGISAGGDAPIRSTMLSSASREDVITWPT